MLGTDETAAALREGAVGFVEQRDVVRVIGPGTWAYLEGQCSQALTGLAVGDSTDSLLLSPQGKIEALVRVISLGAEEALVDVEAGFGELVEDRLRRFKIRVKADLERQSMICTRIVGPTAPRPTDGGDPPAWPGPFVLGFVWPRLVGTDWLADNALPLGAIELGDPAVFEGARIEAGMPRMASELANGVIPQESGLVKRTVSFTKGCYTGQELVARLDARGNRVPKLLRGIVLPSGIDLQSVGVGAVLVQDDKQVGAVTSSGWSPTTSNVVALSYVHRSVEPPAEVELDIGRGEKILVEVRELPLVDS